ncbi:hypothetical protein [Microbulbifer zhoushanensis]|uniref:RipA family octameric membrane protein n=1 Tax=Microbulbifer TaxID=48073 RepID=UPI001F4131EB|nr:hypothetical protein [Microbulbifer zhoushanensis]
MNTDRNTELALLHSRELFIYNAGQRIQSLNFYLVAIAIFLTGFAFLANSELHPLPRAVVGLVIAFAGARLTHIFQELDKRNEQIVQCSEELLIAAEEEISKTSETLKAHWNITSRLDNHKRGVFHHTEIVPQLFKLYYLLFCAGGIYSVFPFILKLI